MGKSKDEPIITTGPRAFELDYSDALTTLPSITEVYTVWFHDAIMYLCITDDSFLKVARNIYPPQLASGKTAQKMLGVWYSYFDQYKHAPGDEYEIELEHALSNKTLTEKDYDQAISYCTRLHNEIKVTEPQAVLDKLYSFSKQRSQFAAGIAYVNNARGGLLDKNDEMFSTITEIHRNGCFQESAKTIREMLATKQEKPPVIISRGLLNEGCSMILSGESGVGKSMFRLELAMRLVLGLKMLGIKIPKKRRVLTLTWEGDLSIEQERFSVLLKSLGIAPRKFPLDDLVFDSPRITFESVERSRKSINTVLNLIEDYGSEVVIYDPLSSIYTGDENNNIAIRQALECVRYINQEMRTSAIIVDHFRKPNPSVSGYDDTAYRTRGAMSKRDWADSLLSLTVRKNRQNKELRELHFVKVKRDRPMPVMLLEWDPDTFLFTETEEEMLVPPKAVVAILSEHGVPVETRSELIVLIKKHIQCSDATATKGIKEAVRKGLVDEFQGKTGRGRQAKGYKVAGW